MSKLILGCGYLGTPLARRWLIAGHRVYGTTRTPEQAAKLESIGVTPLLCDVLNPEKLKVLPSAETIVYAIGFDRHSARSMREVYVQGLANVLATLQKQQQSPLEFIYISSTSVYGQTAGEWVGETAETEPTSESGRIVLEAERVLRGSAIGAIVLRFAGIYGPGRLIRQEVLKSGSALTGDPDKWLNLIHVEDGASAVIAAEERGVPGDIYNVCDDEPVRRKDFYEFLASLIGASPPRFVPDNVAGAAATHSSQDNANRRIVNRKMKEQLQAKLAYPNYRQGLQVCHADERQL